MKEIKSRDNKIIKYIARLASSASFRRKEKAFLCEGARLCGDAMKSGVAVLSALFSESAVGKYPDILASASDRCGEIYVLTDALFRHISETRSPQGVMLICAEPARPDGGLDFNNAVALEFIQDPQNMGTILRSAEAFGIDCVILSKDCCDIFSPKVLRGSMGAVFRQRILEPNDFYSAVSQMNDKAIKTYAAVPRNGRDIVSVDFTGASCVLIGNEGNGLTDRALKLCSDKITIRMNGNAESLNAAVASSLVMWEMVRGCAR